MAPPSRLAIATSAVQRLLKEESSYHKEQEQQESRIVRLEKDNTGENADYLLKQERKALDETKAIFPPLRKRIADSVVNLEEELAGDGVHAASEEDVARAKYVLAQAKTQ